MGSRRAKSRRRFARNRIVRDNNKAMIVQIASDVGDGRGEPGPVPEGTSFRTALKRMADRRDHHGIGRGGTGYRGVFVGIIGVVNKDLHAKQRRQMKKARESAKFAWNQVVKDVMETTLVQICNRKQHTKRAESRRRRARNQIVRNDSESMLVEVFNRRQQAKRVEARSRLARNRIVGDDSDSTLVLIGNRRQ